jgi:hypothetical protein
MQVGISSQKYFLEIEKNKGHNLMIQKINKKPQ